MAMVLPFIEGREYRQEKPARLFSLFPQILSKDVDSQKFVGNKNQTTKLKIFNCDRPRQRENILPMFVDMASPKGKEHSQKRRAEQFSDTDELPPIFPVNTAARKPNQFLEVWNKLNKTKIKIPSCTSPLILKGESKKPNFASFPGKDALSSQYIARRKKLIEKTLGKQGIQRLRKGFSTVTVSWHSRKDHATYKEQELNDLFSSFGPIKCIRFQSPYHAEVEFVWLTSACLAVRAVQLFAPGKSLIFRRWTHPPLQEQLWNKKESWPK